MVNLTCGLCQKCKPKYKRHIDSIYPYDQTQGIVRANLQKLTYYAISKPEKLDKIGAYLCKCMSNDIYRNRRSMVLVGCEAMDSLMTACHSSSALHLYVESFLVIIQKLLETNEPGYEIRATSSFEAFSTKQEDTPGYHRRYDFFISKFSSMCHNNNSNLALQHRLRAAGLKGLRGVIRKSMGDELQANIWEKAHMDKIVPSILFNLHDRSMTYDERDEDATVEVSVKDLKDGANDNPKAIADTALRDLVGKASYGNMSKLLKPIVKHCDYHSLWSQQTPPEHAIHIFTAVMYSAQTQNLTNVIILLIEHLDDNASSRVDIKIGIATVLDRIAPIAASNIGPNILDILSNLLKHLKKSVNQQLTTIESKELISAGRLDERTYQDTLIKTIGDFAYALPNYQKFEVMTFILTKIDDSKFGVTGESDKYLQHVLVRTLLHVATKYETKLLGQTFNRQFATGLMRIALVNDNKVRLSVQHILHTLFDRHDNASALAVIRIDNDKTLRSMDVTVERADRSDVTFWRQHGLQWLTMLHMLATYHFENNTRAIYDAILCTILILTVELGCCDEVVIDMLRLLIALQSSAQNVDLQTHHQDLNIIHRARLHAMVARGMHAICQLLLNGKMQTYVQQVLDRRIASKNELISPVSRILATPEHVALNIDAIDVNHIQVGIPRVTSTFSTLGSMANDVSDQYEFNHLSAKQQLDHETLQLPVEELFDLRKLMECLQQHFPSSDVTKLLQPLDLHASLDQIAMPSNKAFDAMSLSTANSQSIVSNSPSRSRRNTLIAIADETVFGSAHPVADTDFIDLPSRTGSQRMNRHHRMAIQEMREQLDKCRDEKWLAAQEAEENQRVYDFFTKSTFDQLVDYQQQNKRDTLAVIQELQRCAEKKRQMTHHGYVNNGAFIEDTVCNQLGIY